MATSRRELSDAYEAQDLIMQAAQEAKRLATQDYRAHLDKLGMDKDAIKAEVEAFKKAYRRKMDGKKKGTEAVEHVDAIADEIYLEITAPRAPRATRVEIIEEFDAETGEITEPQSEVGASSAQMQPSPPDAERDATSPGRAEGIADGQPIQPSVPVEGSAAQTVASVNSSFPSPVESEAVETSTPIPFVQKPLRPYCQTPGNGCGGMGRKHCHKCEKAHEQAGAA